MRSLLIHQPLRRSREKKGERGEATILLPLALFLEKRLVTMLANLPRGKTASGKIVLIAHYMKKEKKVKKLSNLFLALTLVLSVFASALAAAPVKAATNETETVTLHKLLMDKSTMAAFETPEAYDGTQNLSQLQALTSGTTLKEVEGVYFAWQNEAGQWIDAQGQVVGTVQDALGGKTAASGYTYNTSNLPAGKYKIVEVDELTTYVDPSTKALLADSKAVPVEITLPLLKADGTYVQNAHVYPKNTQEVPTIDKKVEGQDAANAKLGQELTYTVTSTIKADSRYKTLAFKDTMTNGLTFTRDSLAIVADNGVSFETADYILLQDDRGFSLTLTNQGLNKVSAVTKDGKKDLKITLTYKAKVNASAIVREQNKVQVEYDNNPGSTVVPVPVTPTAEGDLTVTKAWQATDGSSTTKPATFNIAYILYKDNNAVATVQVDESTQANAIFHLGNGIRFVADGNAGGKFEGLEQGANYTISERVSNYTPAIVAGGAGTVTVTNKKNKVDLVPPATATVNLYGARFVKTSATDASRLQGAQFVVRNKANGQYVAFESDTTRAAQQADLEAKKKALDDAVKAYNDLPAASQTPAELAKVTAAQNAYNSAFVAAQINYTTVASDTAANVVTLTSTSQGQFAIGGLEAGTYELVEKVAPEGYALLTTPIEFKVDGAGQTPANNIDYVKDSGANDAIRVNNTKLSIPQTGGMGTLIFVAAGLTLMGMAYYAFVKNNRREEA